MGKWIFATLFGGVASVFIIAGIVMAWRQHELVSRAERTQATITHSEVITTRHTSKGRSRTRYSPKITFDYVVSGQRRTSSEIYPGKIIVGALAAHSLVAKYPLGAKVDAHYDPRDANTAYLINRHDFGPYLFILFPMIHLSIGLIAMFSSSRNKKLPPIAKGDGKWLLPTGMTSASKFNQSAMLAGVWWLIGGLAILHFFSVAEKPYGGFPLWASGIYAALGIIPAWMAWHYFSLMNRVSDALVTTDIYPIRRGYPVRVNVKMEMAGGGNIEKATATLVCRRTQKTKSGGKNRVSTDDAWKSEQTFAQPQDLVSDRTIAGDVTFIPSADHEPTSPKGHRGYPKHEWELRINVKRAGPDYRARFTLQVD